MQISVVTPTYYRYKEVPGLLESLARQTNLPNEIILVDGAPLQEKRTEEWVKTNKDIFPFKIKYYRKTGGTAIQRNYGIDKVNGQLIAFIDDDVRLAPDFFKHIVSYFNKDTLNQIGGITGYKTSHSFNMENRARWRWYRRLRLLSTFTPSAYDRKTGYPINAGAQPFFEGVREVDIMTSACTVYRKEIFTELNFHPFFRDYGMLEDNHLALKCKKAGYKNLQCGDAHCEELNATSGRSNSFIIGQKTCLNYYFVFNDIEGPLSLKQKLRFFSFQFFELFRFGFAALKHPEKKRLNYLLGKSSGIYIALFRWNYYCHKILNPN